MAGGGFSSVHKLWYAIFDGLLKYSCLVMLPNVVLILFRLIFNMFTVKPYCCCICLLW